MRAWRGLGPSLLALATACGQTSSRHESSAEPVPGVPEADWPRTLAEAHCRNVFECCDPTGDHGAEVLPVYRFTSEDECIRDYATYYESVRERSLAAGLVYDPECFAVELAGEEALGCSTTSRMRWCAVGQYHGNVPLDGSCNRDIAGQFSDCAKGLTCVSTHIMGVCWDQGNWNSLPQEPVFVEIGEACGPLALCNTDAFCDAQVCVPRLALGAACASGLLCTAGTYCEPTTSICVPSLGVGEPCEDAECEPDHHCASWQEDVANRVCTPDLPNDAPCTTGLACATGWCAEVCAEVPPRVCREGITPASP